MNQAEFVEQSGSFAQEGDNFAQEERLQTQQELLNFVKQTIFNLHNLKAALYKCETISEIGLNKLTKFIKKFLQQIDFLQIYVYQKNDINEAIRYCSETRNDVRQLLNNEQNNNNANQIQKLINEIDKNYEVNYKNTNKVQSKPKVVQTIYKPGFKFEFNWNATIMFANNSIFAFNNHHKLLKTIIEQEDISQLVWMRNSKRLLTRNQQSMIIWNSEWQPLYTFEADKIRSMVVREKDELIIQAEEDNIIQFQKQQNSQWRFYQTIKTQSQIFGMKLNPAETKLICNGKRKIFIISIEHQNDQWSINQTIKIDIVETFVNFVSNNQFVLNPRFTEFFQIFTYQEEIQQFVQTNQLLVSNRYASLFIQCRVLKKQKVLVVSYDNQIYFFKFHENGEYELQQLIQLSSRQMVGYATEDGRFLISRARQDELKEVDFIKILWIGNLN